MKNRLFFCFIFICLIAGVTKAQDGDIERAKALWEKVIAAKGGREKLYAVQTLVVSSKTKSPYDSKEFSNLRLVDVYALPGKWWSWIDQRPGFSLAVRQYDFGQELGYEAMEGRGFSVYTIASRNVSEYGKQNTHKIFDDYMLSTERPAKAQDVSKRFTEVNDDGSGFNNNVKKEFFKDQLFYLMETRWIQPKIEGTRRERVGSKKVDVAEVSFGDTRIDYFIDPKTDLPIQIRMRPLKEKINGYLEDVLYLEDYIEIEGVKFPQVVKRGRKTDSRTVYEVNPEYDEDIFRKPPTIEMKPDAWKSK